MRPHLLLRSGDIIQYEMQDEGGRRFMADEQDVRRP